MATRARGGKQMLYMGGLVLLAGCGTAPEDVRTFCIEADGEQYEARGASADMKQESDKDERAWAQVWTHGKGGAMHDRATIHFERYALIHEGECAE